MIKAIDVRAVKQALTRPYPAYEKVGIRNPGGDYNQLGTTLLQIENEFYGKIRPKRRIRSGERPLHALRERGVEYVEVRLVDLDPFSPIGITAPVCRLIDVFLDPLDALLELGDALAERPHDAGQPVAENQQGDECDRHHLRHPE